MTEAEWLACSDPDLMPDHLRGRRVYDRKLQLFVCACCRLSWELLKDARSRRAVERVERFADRRAKGHELAAAARDAGAVVAGFIRGLPASGTTDRGLDIEISVADAVWRTSVRGATQGYSVTIARGTRFTEPHPCKGGGKGAAQVRFLHDDFGRPYPFPRTRVHREWLTDDVVALAAGVYEERAFDRLTILADAMEEEAGARSPTHWPTVAVPGRTSAAVGSPRYCPARRNRLSLDGQAGPLTLHAGAGPEGGAMTEAKWLACKSPGDMLDYLCAQCGISRRKGGSRKLRLLACACCRRVSHMLTEIRDRRVVVLSEDFADGRVSAEKLEAARRRCLDRALHLFPEVRAAVATAGPRPRAAAGEVMASVCDALASQDADYDARWRAEAGALAEVVREVFGNPFRPASAIVRAWLAWDGGTVPNLAAAVYEERAFDRLPVLADALEEAGCADAAILDHCRGPGSHVRGCWVVDLVLGKE